VTFGRSKTKCLVCYDKHVAVTTRARIERKYLEDPGWRARYLKQYEGSLTPPALAKHFLRKYREADIKRGRECTITKEELEAIITQPCAYCGESTERRGLDRKDNAIGHTPENVVSCCTPCNMIKGTMPYEAWLHILPSVKSAKAAGLFEGWVAAFHTYAKIRDAKRPE
jgi:hypothetical protein